MKVIETQYRDYLFRSRLEARWAKFWDELGLKWEYEIEGYESNGLRYLPDFWLPTEEVFIEIKGKIPTETEFNKMKEFSEEKRLYIVVGNPYVQDTGEREYNVYTIAKYYKDKEPTLHEIEEYYFMKCLQCNRVVLSYFFRDYGDRCHAYYCRYCDIIDRNTDGIEGIVEFHKGNLLTREYMPLTKDLTIAYRKARQERF